MYVHRPTRFSGTQIIWLRSLVKFLVYEPLKNLWLSSFVCYSFGGQFMVTFFCPVICKLRTQTGNITVQYYQPCRTLVMILFSCLLSHTITPMLFRRHSLTCHHGCSFEFQASLFGICVRQNSIRTGFSPITSVFSCQCHPILIFIHVLLSLCKCNNWEHR